MFRLSEESHQRSNSGNPDGGGDFAIRFRRAVRRCPRNTFNREQLVQSAKSLAWVAPLSILIWVYAERQQIRPAAKHVIPFEIKTNDPRVVVTVLSPPPPESSIQADLQGPQSLLEQIVRQMDISSGGHPVVITLPDTLTTSQAIGKEHLINASRIRESDMFRNSGLTISNETPPTLRVHVDKLEDVEVEVLPPAGMENFVSPPQFTPRRVKLTLPRTLLDKNFPPGQPPTVTAELAQFSQIRTPGAKTLQDVPLSLPVPLRNQPNVTLSVDRVAAAVDVQNAERLLKIPSLPIWPLYPPGVQGKYVVKTEGEPTIFNVEVTGPRELIDQIENNTIEPKPKAILEVEREDLPNRSITRKLTLALPQGVKANREYQATFMLVEAEPTPP